MRRAKRDDSRLRLPESGSAANGTKLIPCLRPRHSWESHQRDDDDAANDDDDDETQRPEGVSGEHGPWPVGASPWSASTWWKEDLKQGGSCQMPYPCAGEVKRTWRAVAGERAERA